MIAYLSSLLNLKTMKTDVSIQTSNLDSTNIDVHSVHSDDITGLTKRTRKAKPKVWKYVLGDVYRLCHASDRNDAMLAFGATNHVRVDMCTIGDELVYDLFCNVKLIKSDYDGRNLFEFTFK